MGVLPLQFKDGVNRKTLNLDGTELLSIHGIENMKPSQTLELEVKRVDGTTTLVPLKSRIDTAVELEYYKNDGILHYVLRKLT